MHFEASSVVCFYFDDELVLALKRRLWCGMVEVVAVMCETFWFYAFLFSTALTKMRCSVMQKNVMCLRFP